MNQGQKTVPNRGTKVFILKRSIRYRNLDEESSIKVYGNSNIKAFIFIAQNHKGVDQDGC